MPRRYCAGRRPRNPADGLRSAPVPVVIAARADAAIAVLGVQRVLLVPDCGFATFADDPVTAADVAERKLAAMAAAARTLRARYRV